MIFHDEALVRITFNKNCRIAWPIVFDQPGNAAHISLSLDVAFQLIQVRQGIEGLRPLYRGGSPPIGTRESVAAEARDGFEGSRMPRGTERDEMLKLLEISLGELGRTAETDLRISGDSYAMQRLRRSEDGHALQN